MRAIAFMAVFGPIYERYQESLAGSEEIDFHDMINRATELVESGRFRSPFKYILVDEFQDISPSRAALLKALLDNSPGTQHAPVRSVVQDCWSRPMAPGAAGIAKRTLKPARPATAGWKREWANTVDSMAARTTRSVATCKKYKTSVQGKGRKQSGSSLRGSFTLVLTASAVR